MLIHWAGGPWLRAWESWPHLSSDGWWRVVSLGPVMIERRIGER